MGQIKTRQELINAYLEFFKSKKHHHLPSSSLIPENDPTVLFTTAGMHPLVPYLIGQKHPLGKRLVNVQKCIRTDDIDEVGDTTHHTFFEMLGNWSLGDYFKKEAIEFSFEFLTKKLNIPIERLAVSVFEGDKDAEKDEESAKIWLSLGISKERIAYLPKKDNWWGPAGETGPCGPDTEMFYWKSNSKPPKKFNSKDDNWVEIWNDVFMQYNKTKIKTILIDGINTLFDSERTLNEELLKTINKFNAKKVIVTNIIRKDPKNQTIVKTAKENNLDLFTLEGNPEKTNPKFFKQLLEEFHLNPEEIIYFDHKEENLESAKKAGIKKIQLYKNNKQIKEFIENNFHIFIPLQQKNVDTGMGVERTLAVLNNLEDNYQTSIFLPIIKEIESLSNKKYNSNKETTKAMRIIADHLRASIFILGDERGIKPSNTGQGYVLRRLIRRVVRYGKIIGIKDLFLKKLTKTITETYPDYQELQRNHKFISEELELEEKRFSETLEKGIKKFSEIATDKIISGKEAFLLFQSYGFPIEFTEELANEKGIKVDLESYNEEFQKHQDLSRTSSSGQFKSGLADDSEKTRKLHTETHLLNEALRIVLSKDIKQKGSNITPERLRFDFNFPRKLTEEEIKKIESLINEKIENNLRVIREEIQIQNALKSGAQSEFGAKYPEMVSIYTILDNKDKRGWFSKEFCTGPHVSQTKDIGHFRIIKEESVSAGIRRIKAVVG